MLEKAQRDLVTIYGVSTSAYGNGNDDDDDVLVKLADGDRRARSSIPLENVYKDIAGYLQVPTDGGNYRLRPGHRRILRRKGQQHFPCDHQSYR